MHSDGHTALSYLIWPTNYYISLHSFILATQLITAAHYRNCIHFGLHYRLTITAQWMPPERRNIRAIVVGATFEPYASGSEPRDLRDMMNIVARTHKLAALYLWPHRCGARLNKSRFHTFPGSQALTKAPPGNRLLLLLLLMLLLGRGRRRCRTTVLNV